MKKNLHDHVFFSSFNGYFYLFNRSPTSSPPYQQLEFHLVPMPSGETMTKLVGISYFRKRTKLTQATIF